MFFKKQAKIFFQSALTILVSVLIIFTVVHAGTITPPSGGGEPIAKFYTISEIYTRLTTNATATESAHDFTFSDSLAGTGRTLTEIYNAIPSIIANTVKLGTTYLGVAGTLVPSGGDAAPANILSGKTFFGGSQADWNLQTGTMANIGAQTITPSISNSAITQGYHDGTGYCAGDADLITGNIKSGANIFGVAGDYPSATYVLPGDTAAIDATSADMKTGVEAWTKAGVLTTGSGTQTLSSANDTVSAGYYDAATLSAVDFDLVSNNILATKTIFGVAGNSNVVNTSSGDAIAGNILINKKAWVAGAEITGLMANIGAQTITPSTSNLAITQGYHDGTGYCSGDSDLVAANLASGVDIFGVSGTLLKNLYNGSAGANVLDFAFYTQAKGGVDDYNNNGTMPANSYTAGWTTCDAGNSYCATSDATNTDKKDNSTNLVWSKWLDSGTAHTWFWANNCYEPGTAENPGTCVNNGDDACQCVKKAVSLVGCEALGGGWRLPYQKELMQAYIDGSWGNLSSAGSNYWSATTRSNGTNTAWVTGLNGGGTGNGLKTIAASYRVRCVR